MTRCRDCGKIYERTNPGWGRRCHDCWLKAVRKSLRRSRARTGYDPHKLYPIPDAELAHAHKKPASCSDVRWRIELRRRRDARYYSAYGEKP